MTSKKSSQKKLPVTIFTRTQQCRENVYLPVSTLQMGIMGVVSFGYTYPVLYSHYILSLHTHTHTRTHTLNAKCTEYKVDFFLCAFILRVALFYKIYIVFGSVGLCLSVSLQGYSNITLYIKNHMFESANHSLIYSWLVTYELATSQLY